MIQRWKDRGLTPDRVTPAEDTDFADGRARALYAAYQDRLRDLNSADFGDLMLHMTEILRTHPDVLASITARFRYILVDEYQDTNLVQYLWLRLLAQGHQEHLLRRRRRPVDLFLARRRGRKHPALREGFRGRAHRPAGGQLPLDRSRSSPPPRR